MIEILSTQKPTATSLGTIGQGEGFGPWAEKIIGGTQPESLLATIMSNILGAMTIGAGIWFLFQTIIAGYNYMNAAGDKARIENAGRKLTNSLVGIAVVIAAYGLLALLGSFLGIEFLNFGKLFSFIAPEGAK
ncbi:hypothetical protein MUP35_04550 [Patescibacteria group bacterium]|nr:hypothetical protein [Patescibacteria group bacterium]